jgi:Leucine-rich repeat (LRR) protein
VFGIIRCTGDGATILEHFYYEGIDIMTDKEVVLKMGEELGFNCSFYDGKKAWRKGFCGVGSVAGDFPLMEDYIGIHALCVKERVTALEFYDSKDKPIAYIPETIGSLTKLTALYAKASFTGLPETIGNCKLLKVLNVGCSIRELPDIVCTLTRIEEISLCYSPIEKLPDDIGNLKALKSLNLCGTFMEKLPKSIVNCTSMEELYSYYCPLKELPEDIGKLSNLRSLSFEQTDVGKLPESIGECSKLEELCMDGIAIPESLCNCCLLKELIIGEQVELPKGIAENPNIRIVNGWNFAIDDGDNTEYY